MRAAWLLPLCSAPLLASCIFLLDYDELKSGNGNVAPGGAGGETAGAAGESVGGAGPTCGDCNDGDPCTIDTCDALGDAPTCRHQATEGLKLDGFQAVLSAEQHLRVALVGSGQLFYLSSLETNDDVAKLSLFQLAADGTELEPLGTDLRLDGTPISNIGLAVEELAAGQVALHGYVATEAKLAPDAVRVQHLERRDGKVTSNLVGVSYRADNPTLFPQALAMGGKVVGAWIQADGTIAVHTVGAAKTEVLGDPMLPASTLSLLSTNRDEPAVLFTAQAKANVPLGTFVATASGAPVQLPECQTGGGSYLSSSVIGTQVPGLWLANVTRVGSDYLTTGGGTVACNANACITVPEDCTEHPPENALRNVAGATVHFDADAAGIVYSVLAVPQIAPKSDGSGVEARLSLALGRADFNADPVENTPIGGDTNGFSVVARNDTDETRGFIGPDWPAVAILPGQRAAVAWIGPAASGIGTELHVERYKMCVREP